MTAPVSREIQRLRDRIDELEELLGLHECVDMIPIAISRFKQRTKVVIRLLAKRELISRNTLHLAFGSNALGPKSLDVYVCIARKSLRPFGIVVRTDLGRGWYLLPEDKKKLRELMREPVEVAA